MRMQKKKVGRAPPWCGRRRWISTLKFDRARVINYPLIVVGRIHDHEPSFYIRAQTYFRPADLSARFLSDSWVPENPRGAVCHGPWKKMLALGFIKIHSAVQVESRLPVHLFRSWNPLRSKLSLERKYRIFEKYSPKYFLELVFLSLHSPR